MAVEEEADVAAGEVDAVVDEAEVIPALTTPRWVSVVGKLENSH